MKFTVLATLFPLTVLLSPAYPVTAEKIYFTVDGKPGSASVEPGFQFNHIWNSMGVGMNGHIYTAVSNTAQSENPCGGPTKGDVCLVEYNPYNGTMKSCGTVKRACQATGNWMPNESQEKIHTALAATPDGKLWMATHDNGEVLPGDSAWYDGLFYRGSHFLYIDVLHGDTLVDYSPSLKNYYKKNDPLPHPRLPNLGPSDTSGVAVQWHSYIIMGVNPWNPRYLWTMSVAGSGFFQIWDLLTGATHSAAVSDGNMREIAVSKEGSLYYSLAAGGNAYKRSVDGIFKTVGTGLPPAQGTTVYTHSYDSAFVLRRGTGDVVLYDFVRDTVRSAGKFPGSGNSSADFRAGAISADGKSIYAVSRGAFYQLNLATGQSQSLYDLSPLTSGYSMISGRNIADTLGNFYAGMHKGFTCGEACLLKITLGKNAVKPLALPDSTLRLEKSLPPPAPLTIEISPNPVTGRSVVRLSGSAGRPPLSAEVYDSAGRKVASLPNRGNSALTSGEGDLIWDANGLPAGIYFIRVAAGGRIYEKIAAVLR